MRAPPAEMRGAAMRDIVVGVVDSAEGRAALRFAYGLRPPLSARGLAMTLVAPG